MSELINVNAGNFAALAKLTGIADDGKTSKKTNTLNRLRIWHQPVMGQAEVNGRLTNVETIEGGMFRLEIIEGDSSKFVYSKTVTMRPFMQRFMYPGTLLIRTQSQTAEGSFHRTIMADSLNMT